MSKFTSTILRSYLEINQINRFLGSTIIQDLFILNRPIIELNIFNNWNNLLQTVKLISDESVIVTEKIYDELGREMLVTKPTKVSINSSKQLLVYHDNFIERFNPEDGLIEGLVSNLNVKDEGFPYSRIVYHKNPLSEKKVQGLPGKSFSANGKFAVSYEKETEVPFINAYFPSSHGFQLRVEILSNGSTRFLIYDKYGNKVAKYVEVPGFEHLLSTYEYDDEKRIIKILSPAYHEAVKTLEKVDAVHQGGNLSDLEEKLQQKLGTHFKYDKRGNLIEKTTPDEGKISLFYNSNGQPKFSKYSDGKILFYNYNQAGLLTETGYLAEQFSNEILQDLVDVDSLTSAISFQQILSNEEESTKLVRTTNHNEPILEELKFDQNQKITSQKMTIISQTKSTEIAYEVKRKFIGEKVEMLTYPAVDKSGLGLKLLHTYNHLGQLMALGTSQNPTAFASFTYNANNQIESENHSANNIERKFDYNSPGFLQSITDQYLTEEISYMDGGYGQQGYGDGIVMKTSFDAKWSENIDHEFDLSQFNESCIDFLKYSEYMDENSRFMKLFKSHVETKTPLNCKEKKIFDELSAKYQLPSHYGHRYAYGTHRELVKAKYFSDKEEAAIDPLQPDIFGNKIGGVSVEMSHEIWKVLKEKKFISVDQRRDDWKSGFGSRGVESMIRDEDLKKVLKDLSDTK